MRHIHGILIQWRPRNHHRPFILLVERLVLLAVSSTQQPPLLPLHFLQELANIVVFQGKGIHYWMKVGSPTFQNPQ